jgi:hypothetical protein
MIKWDETDVMLDQNLFSAIRQPKMDFKNEAFGQVYAEILN